MIRALAVLALSLHGGAVLAGPALVALAPGEADDARKAIALGPDGQVYAPVSSGEWVRSQPITTADTLVIAGRAGQSVVAFGDGVVYRLADNGWSAIRLVQKGKAVMSGGRRAVAAVGRQVFALDRSAGGEPAKLAVAPALVLAIGSGEAGVVIQTAGGLLRLEGAAFKPLARAPRRITRLVSERWVLIDRGAVDLKTNATTSWPAGLTIQVAEAGTGVALVAVGSTRTGLELVTLAGTKLTREPIAETAGAKAVGVVVDKAGRATVALADGRLARRERDVWTITSVREALPAPKAGSPPAVSP
ncbi:MAG: hypothetical protein H0T46_28275 [Deltaproteobacteria bacterium]|nr:hypothetical protein [Deltaproteobacteria bacterium]